jgi:DNA-directed RNA polymerase specialized sigma24 family protein
MTCRRAGAAFAREWIAALLAAGRTTAEVAEVVGCTPAAVRSRLSEHRRMQSSSPTPTRTLEVLCV